MSEAVKDLIWVALVLLVLGVIWFLTGGPLRKASWSGPFLNTPLQNNQDIVKNQTPGAESGSVSNNSTDNGNGSSPNNNTQNSVSIFSSQIRTSSSYSAKETDPNKEYITIEASSRNSAPINISGWALLSQKTNFSIKIPGGTRLPYPGRENDQSAIILKPGDTAIVSTGRSPVGASFLTNICTGYFDKDRVFNPSLSNDCPRASDEAGAASIKDQCYDFLDSVSRCEVPDIPLNLSSQSECQSIVTEKLNYNGCVNSHRNDSDFFSKEWRIFLNRDSELWANRRETIILKDTGDKIVDSVSY